MQALDKFPRNGFKGMAGTQIAIGLFVFLLAAIDLGISIRANTSCYYDDEVYPDDDPENWPNRRVYDTHEYAVRHCGPSTADMMGMCATGIWTGIMLVIAGSLGVGAARTGVAHRQSGLKIGFMVLNIINSLLVAPSLLAMGAAEAIYASVVDQDYMYETTNMHIGFGIVFAVLGFIQFVLCIVSASVSCCCAPTVEYLAIPVMQYVQTPAAMSYPVMTPACDDKITLVDNEVTA